MSVSPSSTGQAAAWRLRVPPPPERIRPGLWAIATPVPTPIRYTLCYVLDADGRLLVVDPGWPDDAARESLVAGLAGFGRGVEDIDAVVVTHLHPDHVGLADWLLRRAPGARLLMHPADLERFLPDGGTRRAERDRGWSALMRTVGAPDELGIAVRVNPIPELSADLAERVSPLLDGETLRHGGWELQALHVPGHTPGNLVLLERANRLLLSGDHLLPTISPAITQQYHADDDILDDYLSSLLRVRDLDVYEVLPGHQYRFRGLAERVEEMLAFHRERLDELLAAVVGEPGASCYELTQRISWRSSGFDALSSRDRVMAARETMAHLTRLRLSRRVSARRSRPGAVETLGWFRD